MAKIVVAGVWIVSIGLAFLVGRGDSPTVVVRASEAPDDMAAAITTALGQGSSLARSGQSADILEHLNDENLSEVLEIYEDRLWQLGECEISPFVDAWTGFDPRGAFNRTMAWDQRAKRVMGTDAALLGWALRNPIEARVAFAEIMAEHPKKAEQIQRNLLAGWAHADLAGLSEYFVNLPGTGTQERDAAILTNVILLSNGPEAVTDWVEEMVTKPDLPVSLKRSIFRAGVRNAARLQPTWVAAYAESHLSEEWAVDGPRIISEQWAKRDGLASLTWAGTLEEGRPREDAVRYGFVEWLRRNPSEAKAWLMEEEWTEFHAPALGHYAKRLAETDPVKAVALCEEVLDEDRRYGCLRKSAEEWYALDATAAEAWLQVSPIEEEHRRQIRQPKPRASKNRAGSPRARRMGRPPVGMGD
ncbi:MAG: hypothetical protein VCC04_14055 [Myxococcota bacterium]